MSEEHRLSAQKMALDGTENESAERKDGEDVDD